MGKHHQKTVTNIKERLLQELLVDIEGRFGGNKTRTATELKMNRVQFTNLCNGKEGATIDQLMLIGTKLGWDIEVRIKRGAGERK